MFKILKFKNALIGILVVMAIGVLAVFPSICIKGAKEGVVLAFFTVFPSIFPFMVLARFLILSNLIPLNIKGMDKISMFLFGLPQEVFFPFLAGCVSGYPTGTAVICDMVEKKIIPKDMAEHMLPFCNNCSPLFIIGTIGCILTKNASIGYVLFLIHIVSAIITGMVLKQSAPYVKCRNEVYLPPKTQNAFTTAVSTSISTMLNICGYIILFSVLTNILTYSSEKLSFLCGFLELTAGVSEIMNININSVLKLSLISAFLGFSGICVLLQNMDLASTQNLSIKKYIKGKIIFCILSFVIAYTVFSLNQPIAVFNSCMPDNSVVFNTISALLIFISALIFSIKNQIK
jgi:sporulation integral membrane protein YlbJ